MTTGEVVFAWDIDGTLISTGGAGRSALNQAFAQLPLATLINGAVLTRYQGDVREL